MERQRDEERKRKRKREKRERGRERDSRNIFLVQVWIPMMSSVSPPDDLKALFMVPC